MKKKLIKYTKFIISVALVLSLIAPSYASLSASDGSAFVTKAEFDSALADFNSRLTTFEAGINSKIDSQVTSYLDRNGIWNGKKQTLALSSHDLVLGTKPGSVSSTHAYIPRFAQNMLGFGENKSGYWFRQNGSTGPGHIVTTSGDDLFTLIDTIDKTGLLNLKGSYAWAWAPMGSGWGWQINTDNAYVTNPFWSLVILANLYDKASATSTSSYVPIQGFSTYFAKTWNVFTPCPFDLGDADQPLTKFDVYLFVERSHSLGMRIYPSNVHNGLYFQNTTNYTNLFTYSLLFESAYIY